MTIPYCRTINVAITYQLSPSGMNITFLIIYLKPRRDFFCIYFISAGENRVTHASYNLPASIFGTFVSPSTSATQLRKGATFGVSVSLDKSVRLSDIYDGDTSLFFGHDEGCLKYRYHNSKRDVLLSEAGDY